MAVGKKLTKIQVQNLKVQALRNPQIHPQAQRVHLHIIETKVQVQKVIKVHQPKLLPNPKRKMNLRICLVNPSRKMNPLILPKVQVPKLLQVLVHINVQVQRRKVHEVKLQPKVQVLPVIPKVCQLQKVHQVPHWKVHQKIRKRKNWRKKKRKLSGKKRNSKKRRGLRSENGQSELNGNDKKRNEQVKIFWFSYRIEILDRSGDWLKKVKLFQSKIIENLNFQKRLVGQLTWNGREVLVMRA